MKRDMKQNLDLKSFYPKEIKISQIIENETEINFRMLARTESCRCPHCNTESFHHHGTYIRTV